MRLHCLKEMPGRSLRSSRKGKDANKDWSKLNEGSPLPEEEEIKMVPTAKSQKKKKKAANKKQQQQQQPIEPSPIPSCNESVHDDGDSNIDDDTSGAEICEELLLSDNCTSHSAKYSRDVNKPTTNSSEDDVDIREAKKKLKKLQKKETRQRKELKLQKLVEETKRLEKSLKASKSVSKKKSKHATTTADLRSMSDVVTKVDKLMDSKKLNFKSSSNSDSNSRTDSNGSGSNSSSSDEEKRVKKREKSEEKKKKSGKESKLTSDVKFPQTWPHSTLKFHFVGKDKKYDDLTLSEFCAGFMSILKVCKSSEKKARIQHMEELMYLATHKPWKSVLNYHGACLLEIERGNLKWGDNFQLHGLQSTIFNAVGPNPAQRGQGNGTVSGKQSSPSNTTGGNERIWFCKGYQKGNCTYTRDHYGYLMGSNQLLRHICAKCWLALKKQSPHSEQSSECPLAGVEL